MSEDLLGAFFLLQGGSTNFSGFPFTFPVKDLASSTLHVEYLSVRILRPQL